MTHEDSHRKSPGERLSHQELELEQLHLNIQEASGYLMAAFFKDDTWNVRQAGAYGVPLLDMHENIQEHDWEKEDQLVRSIVKDLGDRLDYYEAAYHFPDNLMALGAMTHASWVDMLSQRDTAKTRDAIATEILARIKSKLANETTLFEQFLQSSKATHAFTIRVNNQTGEYQIDNLFLDVQELSAKWQAWFTTAQLE